MTSGELQEDKLKDSLLDKIPSRSQKSNQESNSADDVTKGLQGLIQWILLNGTKVKPVNKCNVDFNWYPPTGVLKPR